jgi:hypothetical protein
MDAVSRAAQAQGSNAASCRRRAPRREEQEEEATKCNAAARLFHIASFYFI